ncbi:MAG TPA: GAF domain-containing protein, partial [Chloroflexia bacterium]|nr:GAF domain-containing protein [Chloroflexia bacterium]
MEKAIRILLAEDRDRADELVGLLRRNYAVYVASDDVGLLERADQARKEGRPYDLALIAHEPPVLGGAQTLQRLRVLAPTTILVSLVPEAGAGAAGASGLATAPRDDAQGTVRHVQRLLAERLAALERARTEILEPLANLGESLLRQPNLELALRQLYQALDTLIPADYRYVALRDRQRDRLVFPLYYDHGEYRPTYRRAFQPGHGLAEWVITHDTPLVSGEFPAEAQRRGWPPGDPDSASLPQSIMVLPLHLGGHVIGAVACGSSRPSAFNDTAVTLFTFVADLLAGLVASWWTDLQWQRQSDLLAQLDQALAEAADPAAIYATAADAARKLTAMESATVIRHTPAASAPAQYPVPDDGLAAQFGDVLADLSRQLAQPTHGGGAVDYGPASTLLAGLGARGAGRVVSHALTSGGRVDAMLWLLHPTERPFDAHDKAALEAVARRTTQALSLTQTAAARQREQDAFARIAWRAAQEPQLALLLSSALNEIAKIVPWAGAAVWQGDTMLGVVHRVWQEGRQAAIPDQAVPLDSPLGVAATERQWVVVLPARDAGSGDEAAPSGPGIALSLRAYSTAQAPGLLVLERNPGEAPFTEEETTVLLRLGQVVAAGLEKLRWAGLAMLHRRLSAALVAPEGLWDQVGAALSSALPPGGVAVLSRDGAQWRPLTSMLGPGAGGPIAWTGPAAGLLHALRDGGPCTIYERRVLEAHGLPGIGSLALASIDAGGTSVGAIAFWSARARAAGSPECDLLRHGAEHLAPALWTARQSAGNVHDRQLFDLLQTVQEEAANAYDTDTLLRHMLLQTLSSTPANVGAVLLRESGDRLVVRATHPAAAGGTLPQEAYSAALAALRVGEAQYLSTAAGTLACLPLDDASPDGPPRAPLGVL